MKSKITEVCNHDISWFYNDIQLNELFEVDLNDIEEAIKDGFSSGQMAYEDDKGNLYYGQWHIINWRNHALELRNSLQALIELSDSDNIKKARKAIEEFDEQWSEF